MNVSIRFVSLALVGVVLLGAINRGNDKASADAQVGGSPPPPVVEAAVLFNPTPVEATGLQGDVLRGQAQTAVPETRDLPHGDVGNPRSERSVTQYQVPTQLLGLGRPELERPIEFYAPNAPVYEPR